MSIAPPRRVAVAFVELDGRFLIAQRPETGSFAGLWELPGGKCASAESPQDCVSREVLEETGLSVEPVELLAIIQHDYSEFTVEIHAYRCRILSGEAHPLESQRLAWIEWGEIERYRFPEANRALFERIRPG